MPLGGAGTGGAKWERICATARSASGTIKVGVAAVGGSLTLLSTRTAPARVFSKSFRYLSEPRKERSLAVASLRVATPVTVGLALGWGRWSNVARSLRVMEGMP